MNERDDKSSETICFMGLGAAGAQAAYLVAEAGYNVICLEKKTVGSGASGKNPGRMGQGFHYFDLATGTTCLRAALKAHRAYPDYLVAADKPFDSPLRHGRYFITHDSNPSAKEILKTYEGLKQEYIRLIAEDPENEVFGSPETFYRILEPREYETEVNAALVHTAVETSEQLFRSLDFMQHMRQKLSKHPRIKLLEGTEVLSLERNKGTGARYAVHCERSDVLGRLTKESYCVDFIVNSTWDQIEKLNEGLGVHMAPGTRTNRLKALVHLQLPPQLKDMHSVFFCMGAHCMLSNLGDGTAKATFAPLTNIETSTGLDVGPKTRECLNQQLPESELKQLGEAMLQGLIKYIPALQEAKVLGLDFGIVRTLGDLNLSQLKDPTHPYQRRDHYCVESKRLGLISNPCMKLLYFIDNSHLVLDLITQHVLAYAVSDLMEEVRAMSQLTETQSIEMECFVLSYIQREKITAWNEKLLLALKGALVNEFNSLQAGRNELPRIQDTKAYRFLNARPAVTEAGSSPPKDAAYQL